MCPSIRFESCCPLPHVSGFPRLGVLSGNLTPNGASSSPRVRGLLMSTKSYSTPLGLPRSYEPFCLHAMDNNPGNATPPCQRGGLMLSSSLTLVSRPFQLEIFEANSFTTVMACRRPVYASQCSFVPSQETPTTAQHSVTH